MTTNQPTTSTTVIEARQSVAALKQELSSTSPAHGPGTPWHVDPEAELARSEQRLARLEQFEAVLP